MGREAAARYTAQCLCVCVCDNCVLQATCIGDLGSDIDIMCIVLDVDILNKVRLKWDKENKKTLYRTPSASL